MGRFLAIWIWMVCLLVIGTEPSALASGPHWVAGVQFFNPGAKGMPVVWANGAVSYYLDEGALSGSVSNTQAAALVAGAAAVWNSVPTAAVSITQGGSLSEDVNGSNTVANVPAGTGATLPADVQPSATGKPVAVVFDADGSVIDDTYGPGASDAGNCSQNGVFVTVDAFAATGNIGHALVIVNGLCATTPAMQGLLQYQLVRAFGRVLGLDWSQVNDAMWQTSTPGEMGLAGWPVMHPLEYLCIGSDSTCMPNQMTLRTDDVAGLNQLYPVSAANLAAWPGKTVTSSSTVSITGTISFVGGQGMAGVNVELVPIVNGVPQLQYAASAVSGAYFARDVGNVVTGATDTAGNQYGRFGTDNASREGWFALSGVPLPPGASSATYELFVEPVNPLYTGAESVGPYDTLSTVAPSGSAQTVLLGSLSAGQSVTQNFAMAGSANNPATDDGVQDAPVAVAGAGTWIGRLTGYGHVGWFSLRARANRVFTVEATALGANGLGSTSKAEMVLGAWSAADAAGAAPDLSVTEPFNGAAVGLTTMQVATQAAGQVLLGYADLRGDGRPDYAYRGRVLYADAVAPARLSLNGGPIVITGQGFSLCVTVMVNGVAAAVTGVSSTEITAVAPAVSEATGTVSVEVRDPQTLGTAEILDGLSYDAQGSDGLRMVSAPSGTQPTGVPQPMTVQAVAADAKTPAGNVAVTFAAAEGGAVLGCGQASCAVVTDQNGVATVMVAPAGTQTAQVVASLTDGASVTAEFDGGTPPQMSATNTLYVAAGGEVSWAPQALVLAGGKPVAGAVLQWTGSTGAVVTGAATSATNAAGIASTLVQAGPLAAGATANVWGCQNSGTVCAKFTLYGENPVQAGLVPVSGVGQNLLGAQAAQPVVMKVIDGVGHPLSGATVTVYQQMTAWEPPCPATGRCPAAPQLGSVSQTLTSDANGLVTVAPMVAPAGQAVVIAGLAASGAQGSLEWKIVLQQ